MILLNEMYVKHECHNLSTIFFCKCTWNKDGNVSFQLPVQPFQSKLLFLIRFIFVLENIGAASCP
jgi:hypothetical protein